ncbi:flagellar basal body P-ring formation chaperone FlgA [Puniceibacterium sediminis]|uniref:Flagella basal body P-ring formation protein FlgA n=1 Tax=Puniceibacterium sediminis TaxID=1608407 RepID=A0A238WTP7_9RHOB|nr:flagellar basal body P-ring formation chaperone FlgA [Puniceibacterium sediminis]SNR49808.1 flagella basal body P-ring formation protein FlgA [Puniceibacterium sediminis]
MIRLALLLLIFAGPAWADMVIANRTIRAQEIVTADALSMKAGSLDAGFEDPMDVLGLEARVSLYAGRPVLRAHVGPAALIERNQIISLVFARGGLRITSEGRALDRGGVGERIRVMNLDSHTTLFGAVQPDGSVHVSQ